MNVITITHGDDADTSVLLTLVDKNSKTLSTVADFTIQDGDFAVVRGLQVVWGFKIS